MDATEALNSLDASGLNDDEKHRLLTRLRTNQINLEFLRSMDDAAWRSLLPGATSSIISAPAVVMFEMLPRWSGQNVCERFVREFNRSPSFDDVTSAVLDGFQLDRIDPEYSLRGFDRRAPSQDYLLSRRNFVLSSGFDVRLVPRFWFASFVIASWSVEYNRARVKEFVKEKLINGSITRNNINSIKVELRHFDRDELESALDELVNLVDENGDGNGFVDRENVEWGVAYGSLQPRVEHHRGTARRGDGVRSWEDDDAGSGSTHFNTPILPGMGGYMNVDVG